MLVGTVALTLAILGLFDLWAGSPTSRVTAASTPAA